MTVDFETNVSRETLDRLVTFQHLVEKWTPKINLISKSSISEIWDRHIIDSLQLFDLAPTADRWVDLGSGGGFPGLVIAIVAQEKGTPKHVTLVESDQRKCAFLRTAVRELSLNVTVLSKRIEEIPSLGADVLSARALADLSQLLGLATQHLQPDGCALFPKGAQWEKELSDARQMWSFSCESVTSKTNPAAAILKIRDIERV